MGLIVCGYFFAIILLLNSYYLFASSKKNINEELNNIALPAALASLGFAVSVHLIFYGNFGVQRIVSLVSFLFFLLASYYSFAFSFLIPKYTDNKVFTRINTFIHGTGVLFVFFWLGTFHWNPLQGFLFSSYKLFWNIDSLYIFVLVYLIGVPVAALMLLAVKFFLIKNTMYRQQIVLHSFAVISCLAIWLLIIFYFQTFSWVMVFFPLGYIILLVFDNIIFSLTAVFDIKQIFLGLSRFLLLTVVFSLCTGFLTAVFMEFISVTEGWFVSLVCSSVLVLVLRDFIIKRLAGIFGTTSDYEVTFSKALQELDYSKGSLGVLEEFPRLLRQYITCKGIDILISDDRMKLQTVYSDFNHNNTIDTHLACFGYILTNNITVITKAALTAHYRYADIKTEMLEILETTNTEVCLVVREGQKLIGCILLSAKTHGTEYSVYDIGVLNNLYSYFFMVLYYLRNIAKQDIMLTVDREIEMSGQIISAVQQSQDGIDNPVFKADAVSYSAHELGGDFIDYIKLNDRRTLFLIGDVAGKGLSASMSMVILKSVIHTFLQETADFKELIVKLNLFVKQNLPRGTFFAGLFGILDIPTKTLYYLNCGIPLMSMYIASYHNVIEIQGEGRVLGFVKKIEPYLKVRKITMHKDDVLVMTTDGLLDSKNLKGNRFGSERVGHIIEETKAANPSQIARGVYNKLLDFILRTPDDDVTVMVLKCLE